VGEQKRPGYTVAEMCALLTIAKSTLEKRMWAGVNHPPFIKIGIKTFFPFDLYEKWLSERPVRKEISAHG
jgi:hypothetical protein